MLSCRVGSRPCGGEDEQVAETISASMLVLMGNNPFLSIETRGFALFVLQDFAAAGIDQGSVSRLLVAPHHIPDRPGKLVGIPDFKR